MRKIDGNSARKLLGLGAVLVAGLALSGCKETLFTNLDGRDAKEVTRLLAQAHIPFDTADNRSGGEAVSVEASDKLVALGTLAAAGAPREHHSNLAELFPGNGFLVTPTEEQMRKLYGIEQQLDNTLSSLAHVVDAQVHVVLAQDDSRGFIQSHARAAVLLRYSDGADTVALENAARALVLDSVGDLSADSISVVSTQWDEVGAPDARAATVAAAAKEDFSASPPIARGAGIWARLTQIKSYAPNALLALGVAFGLIGLLLMVDSRGRLTAWRRL